MGLIVQKFGGSSVADAGKILAAARKAVRAAQQGNQVVMVVSAMGDQTDHLLDLAGQITETPPARELDMLLSTGEQVSVALMAMAINSLGHKAVSLTGAQIGIRTDSTHTKARIKSISTDRMRKLLDEGNIVIAAGFQGIDEDFDITTLGRGGSDTTAVALAAVLEADACEIYTDVDGVYSTDPRILPEARMMHQVSYDEMLELASLGAGVMHSRSIEFGKKFSTPIHVRSSFSDRPGTMIVAEPESVDRPVSGAALVRDEDRITITGVPDRPGVSLAIFSKIAAKNIAVDMIVQNVGGEGRADISFTVVEKELRPTLEAVAQAAAEIGAHGVSHDSNVAKVSAVGLGMARQTGVAQRMFRALADAGVNILMVTTSEIKISALVARDQAFEALRAVHRAFHLEQEPPADGARTAAAVRAKATAADVVTRLTRLQGMEDLTIDGIALDDAQGLVTVHGVPDRPGIAAALFEAVAAGGILVDLIVQSFSGQELASISFTVPREDVTKSIELARQVAKQLGCGQITSCPSVAKLAVSGIGMRSHVGVAIRMFTALANAGINIDLIGTSEVQVNVVVEGNNGAAALACLQREFADVQH
ncbi:MAG: aspartate kinase [Pirellulales bacterium]|nr:aspartate kinase [Pirellulales bacterium]